MPRFFVKTEQISNGNVTVTGDDAFHISRSLRMAVGEHITVCDTNGMEYDCVLEAFSESVTARIVSEKPTNAEPPFFATIWQALPKGDKLDSIIQKSVECGASEIRIFESKHCIAKAEPKSESKKAERRKRIANEAAKQCGRGILPEVFPTVKFDQMLEEAAKADIPIFCYEGETAQRLGAVIKKRCAELHNAIKPTISIVIGPEGGFSPEEAELARSRGMLITGLGNRILRTETVASFVLGALVYDFELG